MDEIDIALAEAWGALTDRLRQDPDEAERRARRAARATRNPVRPWCLCIRAGDTRINDWTIITDEGRDAIRRAEPHDIGLNKWIIECLTCPVHIGWPGIDWTKAARVLGRSKTIIYHWINHDVFNVTRLYARSVDKIGKPVPYIWSWSPLDPNAPFGQPPHAMWGDMWHDLADRLPDDYEAILRREPHYGGRADTFIGWHFRCPGRYLPIPAGVAPPSGGGEARTAPEDASPSDRDTPSPHITTIAGRRYLHLPCNRNARCLFLPLPCWTIADFKGAADGIPDIKPQWADIMNQPPACHRCWKIRRISLETAEGWNQFVTHISGGLLTGREVPHPLHIVPRERMRDRRRVWTKTPTRRLQVQQLLLEGLKYREIAATLGITWNTVNNHTRRIYRDHDVHSRAELQQKLRPTTPPPTPAAATQ